MKRNIATALCVAALLAAPSMKAIDVNVDGETLKINPTGRILMDGAAFASPDKELFKDGMAIPDIRMGVKASYGKWSAKIDIGFSGGKVGLKDVYMQYNFDKSTFLRGGSFIHQYGLQSSTSSSMKCSFEEPLSNTVFNASRQIGLMLEHSADKYLATFSGHVEPQSMILTPNQTNHQGFGLLSRIIARPYHEPGKVVQVGISGGFTSSQTEGEDNPHDLFSFSGNFPTRVDKVAAVDAQLLNSRHMWKFTPELLLSYGPVALEAQYFYNRVSRKQGLHAFTGQGAYGMLRGLIKGDTYDYAMADGGLATPAPKSLELVLLYNYTSLSDSKAQWIDDATGAVMDGVYGGRVNTLSATLNYYINKYMLVRLNYSYTHRWDAASLPSTDLNTFQARIQILF